MSAPGFSSAAVTAEPLERLRERTSAKWALFPSDVLPLPVAEMDYPLAESISLALHSAVDRSDTGYFANTPELPEAFASFALDRWAWRVDPARTTSSPDVSVSIVEVLRAATGPGDAVIITPPVYAPFFSLPVEAGASVVEVPLLGGVDEGYRLDLDGIDDAFARGARAMLLCNPHNPTGTCHDRDTLVELADIATRHGATIVSDEVHGPLAFEPTGYTPFLTVSDAAAEHGIALTSASKTFNLAGLKCSLIVSGSDRGDALVAAMADGVRWRTSQFGAIAAIAAYRDATPWLDGVLVALDRNRNLLADLLADRLPEARYRIPESTYLAWIDLSALGWGGDPADHILTRAGVALSSGSEFGAQTGRGHVRLNFACSPELLTEAVARIAASR